MTASLLVNGHTALDPNTPTGTIFVRGEGICCAECGWLLRSIYPWTTGDQPGAVTLAERQHAERYPA